MGADSSFDLDVVVIGSRSDVAGAFLAERGLFMQGDGVRWSRLGSPQSTECTVDIAARNDSRAASKTAKMSDAMPLLVDERHHVQDDIGPPRAQTPDVLRQRAEVTMDVVDVCGKLRLGRTSMENGHFVALHCQQMNDLWSDEAGSTEHEDPHLRSIPRCRRRVDEPQRKPHPRREAPEERLSNSVDEPELLAAAGVRAAVAARVAGAGAHHRAAAPRAFLRVLERVEQGSLAR